MLKDLLVLLCLMFDPRCWLMLLKVHLEFRRDRQYRFRNLARALWHVARDERIVKVRGGYLVSSFLPPIPSRAYGQVFRATPGTGTRFGEHVRALRTAPISLFVAVTARCAYRCWHCSAAGREGEPTGEQLRNVLRQLQDMGTAVIGLTGGEPLLRKDVCDLIASLDDRSVSILYTSGQGLDAAMARELRRSGLFAAGVSLDSTVAETFDQQRGMPGAWESAVAAVGHLRRAGIHTMVQCVATREMLRSGDVWRLIHFAHEIGAHEVRILETMPAGRLAGCPETQLLTLEERRQLIEIQRKANWMSGCPKVTVFAHTESGDMFGCGAATQHSYIDAAGNLCPCDFVPLGFGNVFERPVADLWREMNAVVGRPRGRCLAMELAPLVAQEGHFPLRPVRSEAVCRGCEPVQELPRFYRILAGERR